MRYSLAAVCLLASLLAFGCGDDNSDNSSEADGFFDAAIQRSRQDAFLAFETAEILRGSVTNAVAHMERARRDPAYSAPAGSVGPHDWDGVFAKIDGLADTSDFDILRLLTAVYADWGHPFVHPDTWQRTEDTILAFKYWYTQPTAPGVTDDMWYWTENHLITFHTCEFLAGQRYPDRVFTHTGMTGAEHRAHARQRLLDWFELRARFGFSEWLSNVYYAEDLRPLITLIEFADDEEIVRKATMALDLLVYDMALHSYRGGLTSSAGRTYKKDKMSARDHDVFQVIKLLFDRTAEDYGRGDTTAVMFARAQKYRIPEVLIEAAESQEPTWTRQRMGIQYDEHETVNPNPQHPYGFGYETLEDMTLWWSMSNLIAWQVVSTSIELMDLYNLWDSSGFAEYSAVRGIAAAPGVAVSLASNLSHAANMALLEEVNLQSYRTANYMLSSAVDYRKGSRSNQSHTWQATLGTNALVFTTHPGHALRNTTDWGSDGGPGFWTGTASIPRAGQHQNVAIYIYAPQYRSNPTPPFNQITQYEPYTHAYFPQDHFDVMAQDGNWTFGSLGDGYVALYSYREPRFVTYDPTIHATRGMLQPFELRAEGGPDNVWIVELGDRQRWGSFEAFRAAIAAAPLSVTPITDASGFPPRTLLPLYEVRYDSPSQGRMEMGWAGPLRVAGVEQPLDGYPRYETPWGRDEFQSRHNAVHGLRGSLELDFETWERRVTPAE